MAVLYLSASLRGAVFQTAFAAALPDMPFHIGQAPDPLAVHYLVTWTVPEDLAARFPNLRLIISVGAGVDQFDLAALPLILPVLLVIWGLAIAVIAAVVA